MNCPLPRYYLCHVVVALVIAALVSLAIWPLLSLNAGIAAGCAAGISFYAGREFTQKEQGGGPGLRFDWPGIAAPTVACVAVFAIAVIFLG